MSQIAFKSDELELEDWERAAARAQFLWAGMSDPDALIQGLRQHGHKVDGYVESALTCTLDDYNRVKEVYDSLPEPDLPKTRRRR